MGCEGMEVKIRSLIVVVIVLTSTFYLALVILPVNVMATTRYVGGTGPGNYSKIQLAIDASSSGDTVYVYSGTYNEDVSIARQLTLIGENANTTIIHGSGSGDTVLVIADGVRITGFTAENGGTGIRLFFVQNCYIANSIVTNNLYGISVWQSSFNTVQNNTVSNDERSGIYVWLSSFNTIQNNTASSSWRGIHVRQSSDNWIANNTVSNNTAGIYLERAHNNTIANNTITNNSDGIILFNSSYAVLANNLMTGGGVFLYGGSIGFWNNHSIDTSNTLNGKPVHYWKNVTGGSIPLGAGQVILVNSSNIVINNQDVSNGSVGIAVTFSSHVTITNSVSSWNYHDGIYIYSSDNITIADNNMSNNGNDGIFMGHSITNALTNNIASSNGINGIHLFASDLSTITKNGIFLNGPPSPPGRVEHCAIHLSYSNHSVITENSVLSNLDCAFSLVDSDFNNVHNNNFSNNKFEDNGIGVVFGGADGNRFTNNTIHGNVGAAISVGASSHNVFALNTIGLHRFGMIFSGSQDNTIVGNHVSSKYDNSRLGGITISASTSHVLSDNVMVGDGLIVEGGFFGSGGSLPQWNTHVIDTSNTVNGRPVYYWKNVTGGTVPLGASEVILANCTGVIVQNQNLDTGTAGIELGFSSNNTVSSNTVKGSKRGIYLYSSDDNVVAGNTVTLANARGIYIQRSNRNTISGNDLWGNKFGIAFANSDNSSVTDNNVWDNTKVGISISHSGDFVFGSYYGSFNNTIINNTVFNNGKGISIYGSSNNTVAYNSVVNSANGLSIEFFGPGGVPVEYSRNNKIHHNNVIDNAEQAYDNQGFNQWDDGYPSGGNYWGDYAGVDVFSGPNQDIPGSDWIGDTPYIIDFDSQDRYPLVNPVGTYPPSAPLNLSATAGDQQITLTWNTPSFDGGLPITNYRIYRGTTSGGEIFYAQIGIALTFPDFGLTNGQMYCYRVSALNGVGEGPMSNEVCATPTTTPGAPVILQADLSGNGLENVTITWDLSSDDGAGQDSVVRYSINRGTTFDVNAVGYQPVATVPSGTIQYNDNMTGEGDPNNYFYRICAVDLNNLTNCSANQAGKFTLSLMNGPNLVSIPLMQSDENIETVLQTVKWDKAWTYNSSDQKWKSHMIFKPYKGELEEVNTSMGVWINVMQPSNLTFAGIVPSSTPIYLHAGWNLVGFPSFNGTYAVSDLNAAVGVEITEGFEALTPPYFLRALADGEILQTGFGYWIRTLTNGLWTVINS